jgi:biotin carboxylase
MGIRTPPPNPLRRVLLVAPSTSYRIEAFVVAAQRLGVELTLACDVPAPQGRHGVRLLSVDLGDPVRGAQDCLRALPCAYDGVLGADEASALVAAHVAARLGLSANDPDGVLAARDKRRMRARLGSASVPQPVARVVEPNDDVETLARTTSYPCVVKPPMLTGSQGVIRANDGDELVAAVARIRRILERHSSAWSKNPDFHRLLVEEYVEGPEIAVEAVIDAGRLVPIAVFDKPDALTGPFFEETLYVTPSRHEAETLDRALTVTERAARALGLVQGPIHAELRLRKGHPLLIEIAARSIGGLCSRSLELASDNLEELLIRHAVGLAVPQIGSERRAAGVMMIPIPKSGVFRGVAGIDGARAVPNIDGVEIAARPGDALRKLPEGSSYLGFLFAHADTPAEVEAALRKAHAELRFDLAPLLEGF